jgi:ABC-type lipoprotein export system ATPase subunit
VTTPFPPEPTTEPLVSLVGVAHTYGRGTAAVVAVHDVTCQVRRNSRVAVTGPSGSGKSTLLHLLAGLVPATVGTVTWPGLRGNPLTHPGLVGIVFQGPSLLASLDVLDNVAFPLLLADTPAAEAGRLARLALEQVGIAELAPALPQELSGGQAQRVAVARVLACRPTLILADEPTGQLDHRSGELVLDVLLAAADDLGAALLVATHDPLIAGRVADRWTMRDGRVLPAGAAVGTR